MQNKEINALLDTGAEKNCMLTEMFSRLKLSVNKGKTTKLQNASGKDMKTHRTTTATFKMGNTILPKSLLYVTSLLDQ